MCAAEVGTADAATFDCGTSGTFTVTDDVVTGNTGCVGAVTIPATVTAVAPMAFFNATGPTSVAFSAPSRVTSIGSLAFYANANLRTVALPSSVTSIGTHAFENASSLTAITIPSGVPQIEERTFSGATSLASVTFASPSTVRGIGARAFEGTPALAAIEIPATVETIGAAAFNGAGGLTTVTFAAPSHLTTIGDSAFYGTGSLTTVAIPSTVTTIDSGAFFATGLTTITFAAPSHLSTIGSFAFYGAANLEAVAFPSSLEVIRDMAFDRATRLREVAFASPSSLESLSYAAFRGTALGTVTIPGNVVVIGDQAFADTLTLASVYFEGVTAPFVDANAFSGSASGAIAYHLPGSVGYDPATTPNLSELGSALYLPAPPAPGAVAGQQSAVVSVRQAAIGPAPSSVLVTANPGGGTCTVSGPSGSCTVAGLTAGVAYTFTARAHTDAPDLTSLASPVSTAVTPSAPDVPAPFRVSGRARQLAGGLALTVVVREPGEITMRVAIRGGRSQGAAATVLCSTRRHVSAPRRITLVCQYTRRGRALLVRGRVRAMQVLTFRPLAGPDVVATSALTVKRLRAPTPSRVTG